MLYFCLVATSVLLFFSWFLRSSRFNLIATTGMVGFWFYFAYTMTEANVGAETLEFEDGVSLRQDSQTQTSKNLFIFYRTRSHMGGGLSGGK